MIIKEANRLRHIETYYFATKLAEIRAMEADGKPVINLGIGSPDLLPDPSVVEGVQQAANHPLANKYQSYKGIPKLRNAFAGFNKKYFGTEINPNTEILPLMGSKEGIMHISMSFLNPGDQVLIPNPGYPAYAACAKITGAEIRFFELEEKLNWLPDLDKLDQRDLSKTKLMWVNYPNMPTGAKADSKFFKKLLTFGKKHQILICHDNPYTFILNENPESLIEVDGPKSHYLELQSLSKNFSMAGWRVGALISSKEIVNTVMKFKSNMDSGMYFGLQEAAVKALSLEQSWFDHINQIYEKRRKLTWRIMDLLECSYNKDSAGLFVWGRIPDTENSAEDFSDKLLYNCCVFAAPGFIFGSAGDRYIRFSLCADEKIIEKAFIQIEKYMILEKGIA